MYPLTTECNGGLLDRMCAWAEGATFREYAVRIREVGDTVVASW